MTAAHTVAQAELIARLVERAQGEILADIASGRVPATVATFGDLHDFVDANEYGGLCEDDVYAEGNALFPERTDPDTISTQGFMDAANEVQDALDAWIKTDAFRDAAGAAMPA